MHTQDPPLKEILQGRVSVSDGLIWITGFISNCNNLWNYPFNMFVSLLCVRVCVVHINYCVPNVWSAHRARPGQQFSGVWNEERRKTIMRCSEFNLGTLRENQEFLSKKPSHQTHVEYTECKQHNFILSMAAKTWLSTYITFSSPREILLDTMLGSLMYCRQCCNQHWWASTSLIHWVLWEGTHEPGGGPGLGFGGPGTLTDNQDGKPPISSSSG